MRRVALPLRDATAGVVLCVFAPRGPAEIARVLEPGGALVLVTPTARHLAELVEALGLLRVDARKEERVAASVGSQLEPAEREELSFALALDAAAVRALASMGPSTITSTRRRSRIESPRWASRSRSPRR